jgi:hypothetical protein
LVPSQRLASAKRADPPLVLSFENDVPLAEIPVNGSWYIQSFDWMPSRMTGQFRAMAKIALRQQLQDSLTKK